MNAAVARSKTKLRFIFLLKSKSKLSKLTCGSRNCACFRRRSSSRSPRRVSSSDTRQERKSMGTIGSAWANRTRRILRYNKLMEYIRKHPFVVNRPRGLELFRRVVGWTRQEMAQRYSTKQTGHW